jgi:ubiquinone/menaquinone biosynthesis C-methylase UbiE
MNQTSPWETQEIADVFNQAFRTIDNLCPPLRKYLTPGSNVLDVGCASGRLSRDVAIVIDSGTLTGVDHSETSISLAQAEAHKSQITNAEFLVRDAYSLGFEDDTFDLTYSVNVAVWLQDPLRAIQEQRRVTKPGGWVAVQMADYGNITWYPPAPTVDSIINSLADVRNLPEGERVIDSHQARRSLEIMAQAGFQNAQIDGWASIITPKSERFDEHFEIWKTLWLSSVGMGEFLHKVLLSNRLTDESMYEAARAELKAWHAHPHAIYMQTSYLVAAQVS